MKNIIVTIITLYLAVTLFYCMPINPIKIKYSFISKSWDVLFPQNWSFFAPPPQFNFKLYYRFYNSEEEIISQKDVVTDLWKLKRERSPFNSDEEVIDYIIGSSLMTLNTFNNNLRKEIEYQYRDSVNFDFNKKFNDTVQYLLSNNTYKNVPVFNTLSNYGIVLSHKIKNSESFDFVITSQDIPKYINKHKAIDSLFKTDERLLFISNRKIIDDYQYSYIFR